MRSDCLPLTCARRALLWKLVLLYYLLPTEESSASRLLTMHHSRVLHNKRIYILKYSAGERVSLVAMAMCRHSLQDAARTHACTVKANGHGQKAILVWRGEFQHEAHAWTNIEAFYFPTSVSTQCHNSNCAATVWEYNAHDILSGF